jgi:5-methylcytosine-specific restriction protein A
MIHATLRNLRPRLPVLDLRTARPAVKRAERELLTGDHRAWREAVLQRAGYRCEWVERGVRCERTSSTHRMFADHVVERQDGGAALDVTNGRCLCARHHGLKTFRERAKRMARPT